MRRPERFEDFLLAGEADARGRTGLEALPYPQSDLLRGALTAAQTVDSNQLDQSLTGSDLGKALRDARLVAIKAHLRRAKAQPPP